MRAEIDIIKNMTKTNAKTQKIVELLKEIVSQAEKDSKILAIAGGFAMDIEASIVRGDQELSRNHDDLDLSPQEKDIPYWKAWFEDKNFKIDTNDGIKDKDKAFIAFPVDYDSSDSVNSYYADVYSYAQNPDGTLYSCERGEKDEWEKTWDEVFVTMVWQGMNVSLMRHQSVIGIKKMFHEQGHEVREKDLHDFGLFDNLTKN